VNAGVSSLRISSDGKHLSTGGSTSNSVTFYARGAVGTANATNTVFGFAVNNKSVDDFKGDIIIYSAQTSASSPAEAAKVLSKTGFNVPESLGNDTNAAQVNYGFKSELNTLTRSENYGFYAAGSAPNYFRGDVRGGGTPAAPGWTIDASGNAPGLNIVFETGRFTPDLADKGSITLNDQFGAYQLFAHGVNINTRVDWRNGAGNTNDIGIVIPFTVDPGTVASVGTCIFLEAQAGVGTPIEPIIFQGSNVIKFLKGSAQVGALSGNVLKYSDLEGGDLRVSIFVILDVI